MSFTSAASIPFRCGIRSALFFGTCLIWLWNTHYLWHQVNKDSSPSPLVEETPLVQWKANIPKSNTTADNTIVTAYFELPSKFASQKYLAWMANMLSLQDAMVIYTSSGLVSQIKKFRSHALEKTIIVPMEIDKVPLANLYSKEFWQAELDRDFEKRIHRSYQLFWVWLSKSWFVSQAIEANPFQSSVFVWSDIGCFRNGRYNHKEMVQHREVIPRHAILQMAHHVPNAPSTVWWNDKKRQKQHFYHSGSQAAGFGDSWLLFHLKFMETLRGFVQRDMFIGEDQAVMQSTCLRYPTLCEYIPFDQIQGDNHYFGLRYALHHGGNFTTWRPPKQ